MATFSGRRTAGGSTWGRRAVLGREPLEGPDRDRLVERPAPAGRLARGRADPAADRGERVDLGRHGIGVVVATGADEADVATGVGARPGRRPGRARRAAATSASTIEVQTCHGFGRLRVVQRLTSSNGETLVGLSASRVTAESGIQPPLGCGPLDPALAGRQRGRPVHAVEGHDDDRAFAGCRSSSRCTRRPGPGTPSSSAGAARPGPASTPGRSGRVMSRASTGQTSMHTPQLMQLPRSTWIR